MSPFLWFWDWWRWRHRLQWITLHLRKMRRGKVWRMNLTVKLGDQVIALLEGHSAINGAVIPEDASIQCSSNDPTVAVCPATLTVPPGGAQSLSFPITVLGIGFTDFHITVGTRDSVYEATATLAVEPAPIPGLARVSLTLSKVELVTG